jgi:hypothetical protein
LPNRELHIVAFDIPYPPDYGGAIDLFYKIKSLSAAGCNIYLHCFEYRAKQARELEQYCKQVWYYRRKTGIRGISLKTPYIVYSRRDKGLLQNLQSIDAPVLFEGVHTTYYLSHPSLQKRYKAIRNHNVEHIYYDQLYKKENKLFKKLYYKFESLLLKRYEHGLKGAQAFFPLSLADRDYFKQLYPEAQHAFVAPFHPYNEVSTKTGSGKYCLYHGNLQHPENREAALFLLNDVIPQLSVPFIIAGKQPGDDIVAACNKLPHCKLIANPSQEKMGELIRNAHIHVLPTFQPTGMKLKLLYALFAGRHVLVNEEMLHGTNLNAAGIIANNGKQMIDATIALMPQPFTDEDVQKRAEILRQQYNNHTNAEKLITYLLPRSL